MNTSHDNTATPAATSRPIGYWLKATDALIAREFATRFEAEGITRRDWRLLNALADPAVIPDRLRARLERGGKRLQQLEERGWIARNAGGWELTPDGEAARERLGAIVQEVRDRVSGAVSPEDFATTVASLEAIALELGWTEDLRLHRRGPRGARRPGRMGYAPHFGPDGRDEHPHNRGRGSDHSRGCDCDRGHSPRDERSFERGHDHDHGYGHRDGHGHRFNGSQVTDRGYGHERGFRRSQDHGFDRDRGFGPGHHHDCGRGCGDWRGDDHSGERGHGRGQGHGRAFGHDGGGDRGYRDAHARNFGPEQGRGRNFERGFERGLGEGQTRGDGRGRGREAIFERGFGAGYFAGRAAARGTGRSV